MAEGNDKAEDEREDKAGGEGEIVIPIKLSDLKIDEETQKAYQFVTSVYGDWQTFVKAVIADIVEAHKLRQSSDSQFARRTHLRACFAAVDGILFAHQEALRRFVANESRYQTVGRSLSDGERAILQEIEYELEDNGKVKVRGRNFQPFLKLVRFTIAVWHKDFQKEDKTDYSRADGWGAFQKAYKIRNRITHPKKVADLDVTNEEMEQIRLVSLA